MAEKKVALNRIREVLEEQGRTQTWLAKKLGPCLWNGECLVQQSRPTLFNGFGKNRRGARSSAGRL
jgi:hypothetical protein